MSVGGMRRGPQLPYNCLPASSRVPAAGCWPAPNWSVPRCTPSLRRSYPRCARYLTTFPASPSSAWPHRSDCPTIPQSAAASATAKLASCCNCRRRGAILAAPCGAVLDAPNYREARERNGGHLDIITWRLMSRIREVREQVQPYWQRTVYEVCPELSLHQLNDNKPMTSRKRSVVGQEERRALLVQRFPGSERILDAETIGAGAYHRTDACAALWTARRLVARAVLRLPQDPEWSSQGLRMEIVR